MIAQFSGAYPLPRRTARTQRAYLILSFCALDVTRMEAELDALQTCPCKAALPPFLDLSVDLNRLYHSKTDDCIPLQGNCARSSRTSIVVPCCGACLSATPSPWSSSITLVRSGPDWSESSWKSNWAIHDQASVVLGVIVRPNRDVVND